MISKELFDNMSSKNILNDYKAKDMSTPSLDSISDSSLQNMIINSNLDNSSIIK